MTPAFFHPHVGGIESHSFNLAKELVRRGHEVHVVTSKNPPEAPPTGEEEGIRIHRLRSVMTVHNAPLLLGLAPRLRRLRPELIHTHLPSPYIACASAALARLRGTPSVLTYHNDIVAQSRLYSLMAGAYNSSFGKMLLDSVDRVICTSSGYAHTSSFLAPYMGKVVPVVNGVDTEFFHPGIDGSPVTQRFGDRIILFVGSLTHTHSYKGVDFLIRAARFIQPAVPDARIVVVGSGPLRKPLEAMSRRQGVEEMVRFVGYVRREDLPTYYAAASVIVLPSVSRAEGCGLVLLEAMACGKPVVGTTVGGIPFFVRDGENGFLIPPRDPKAIARAVVDILSDQPLARGLGARGRALVERDYCCRTMVDHTERVYQQVLS